MRTKPHFSIYRSGIRPGTLKGEYCHPSKTIGMRVHFWPLLIGALVLTWGIVTIVGQIWGIKFEISWWAVLAVILGLWILSHAVKKI
jgi:hypothetical protein